MKIISAILALVVGTSQATYHPFYHGYNPFAALASLGLYHPHMFPAPHIPYSGTYSYHDGDKPTVVQTNNDGYKFPRAGKIVHPVSFAYHDVPKPTIVQVNTPVHPVPNLVQTVTSGALPTVVQANHGAVPHPYAPNVPYHGTYAYHDGDKPTVVQANNAAYSYPHAAKSLYSGTYSYHDGYKPTVVQVNNGGYKPASVVPSFHSPNPWAAPGLVPWHYHYGYPGQPHPYSIPHKTVVQANLGGHDPWNYGAYYGTGIYGFKYHNYAPAAVPVLRIERILINESQY